MKKVAFLFLIYDEINLERLWYNFFRTAPKDQYSIWIHWKGDKKLQYFDSFKLKTTVPTEYADLSLVKAQNLLLRESLKDLDNERFVFLSNSCIPLKSFKQVHAFLLDTPYCHFNAAPEKHVFEAYRGDNVARAFGRESVRKASQWSVLNRAAAQILAESDEILESIFEPGKKDLADEYFYLSYLHYQNKQNQTHLYHYAAADCTTFEYWDDKDYRFSDNFTSIHPEDWDRRLKTYFDISREELRYLLAAPCLFGRKFAPRCLVENCQPISEFITEELQLLNLANTPKEGSSAARQRTGSAAILSGEDWHPDPEVASQLVAERKVDAERWGQECSHAPEWDARSRIAAQLLEKPAKILDLGAGRMALRQYLPEGSHYIPADLAPLAPDVLKIDLNQDELPDDTYDVVSMLGVFEYLFDGFEVLRQLARKTEQLIISYCCLTGPLPEFVGQRRSLGWANDFTESAFLQMLLKAGFYHLKTVPYNEHEGCQQKVFMLCTNAEAFKPDGELGNSLYWHQEALSQGGELLRWYRFVNSLRQRMPDNATVLDHHFQIAKLLGDQDAILQAGRELMAAGKGNVATAISVADVLRFNDRPNEALNALFQVSPESESEEGLLAASVNRIAFSSRIDPVDLAQLANVPPHPIIRPDLADLSAQLASLREPAFESLGRAEQLIVLDHADLSGEIQAASALNRRMNGSEAVAFNVRAVFEGVQAGWGGAGHCGPRSECTHGLLTYTTENLGDDIQSIAALRFLPRNQPIRLVNRDDLGRVPGSRIKLIINGWFGHMHPLKKECSWPPSGFIDPVFVSFHVSPAAAPYVLSVEGLRYLRAHQPIGCRDAFTQKALEAQGVEAWVSGCLTATLPRLPRDPLSDRIMLVDLDNPFVERTVTTSLKNLGLDRIESRTHDLRVGRTYPTARLYAAHKLLGEYVSSRLVITSRLHCAIPCAAMGVPVIFVVNNMADERLSGVGLEKFAFTFLQFSENPEGIIRSILDGQDAQLAPATHILDALRCRNLRPMAEGGAFMDFEDFAQPRRMVTPIAARP